MTSLARALGFEPSHAAGQISRVTLPDATADLRVGAPDGSASKLSVTDGGAVWAPVRIGFQPAKMGRQGEEAALERLLAVNAGPSHNADVRPVRKLRLGELELRQPGRSKTSTHRPWTWLLLAALLLLTLEWVSYHRGLTA
ncbi:MAG: hypothetical protein MJD61_19345 [Proteobacteria bacterium]|nr:hypothetical protein [Pseudomonadota bacterium]